MKPTLFALLLAIPSLAQQGTITTFAGTGSRGFSGDGGPAASAQIAGGGGAALGVATDSQGNLFIVDGGNNRIRKVNAAGVITTVAGGGPAGSNGDGGPATSAQVFPGAVAIDSADNLFIATGANIRKVNTAGIISTIAGNGNPTFSGDGGPATAAGFLATSVAVDPAGNIYISDTLSSRIRKINTSGIISTFAGNGTQGFSGDGGPAVNATLTLPQGLATDATGNVYFVSLGRIRKVDTAGVITTVAGSGSPLSLGDGGPATSAGMSPTWVTVDTDGNLYIADTGGNRIRKVNTSGIISTFAGGNLPGFAGDGGPAIAARLFGPTGVAVDPAGNVYIADTNNIRIRKVSSGASGSPILANPASFSFSFTPGTAEPPSQTTTIISPGATLTFTGATTASWLSVSPTSGPVNTVLTVSVNPTGLAAGVYNANVVLTPSGVGNTPLNIPVRFTVNAAVTTGIISTLAGNGLIPFTAPGVGTGVGIGVSGVAVDAAGNVYAADNISNRAYKIDPSGALTLLAGNGSFTFAGDGGPGATGSLFFPSGIAADTAGNVYIADSNNNRVRKVNPSGTLSTFAGTSLPGFAGDGGPANQARLSTPTDVATDGAGNVYIADSVNSRVRKVSPTGVISTVAGGALLPTFSGDGGAATAAGLFLPGGLAVDNTGNLYIADIGNNRIRKVSPAGIISTVAGNGTKGFSGDGGPATSAALNLFGNHIGLAIDSTGNLYIPDFSNHRIRKVDSAGIITTIAGNGIAGFSGDGNPATTAGINSPTGVAVDAAGSLYIADGLNRRIRKVTFSGTAAPPAITSGGVVNGASFSPTLAANSWATILGSSLASGTNTWANAIVNGRLPSTLDGVSVTIGGKPAYLYFISPTQLNLLVPDVPPGAAELTVTTAAGISSVINITVSEFAPAFFQWPGSQPVATRQDFTFAAKPGTFSGLATTPARPGDVIILWGTGFGATVPAAPSGVQIPPDRTYSAAAPVMALNGAPITVFGAALAPGFAGLYQIAVQIPATIADGEWPILATVGGVSSASGIVLTVRR